MKLQQETTLQGGKYIIKKVLGQGGFGITYLAEQNNPYRQVAIKEFFFRDYCDRGFDENTMTMGNSVVLSPLVSRFKEKFIKESRIISHLDHPNIVKILDVFEENNTAYYVMDYIPGVTLADIVSSRGPLSEKIAVGFILEVAKALEYVHSQHINHLDVKPANIMVRQNDNHVFLLDFGTSKQYDAISGSQTSTTPVGLSHGYAPIEQYENGGVREFTPQTDIYALGATLYNLVTGVTPPNAINVLSQGLPKVDLAISEQVRNSIRMAMQIRKENRPQTISDFIKIFREKTQEEWNALFAETLKGTTFTYTYWSRGDYHVEIKTCYNALIIIISILLCILYSFTCWLPIDDYLKSFELNSYLTGAIEFAIFVLIMGIPMKIGDIIFKKKFLKLMKLFEEDNNCIISKSVFWYEGNRLDW